MFGYYLWLATRSIKGAPWLSGLMIFAIALGIGTFMTTYTVFYTMSGNPIPHKSDQLFAVRLDNWNPEEAWEEPNEPPPQMTYRDARFLAEAGKARYQTAMFRATMTAQPSNPDVKPFTAVGRLTYSDFFPMFEPEFIYGGPWTRAQDESQANVVVLSREMNDKLFGGEDSVGQRVRLDSGEYTVVGVIDDFDPRPRYYDVINTQPFSEGDEFYLPFTLNDSLQLRSTGNNSCYMEPPVPTYQGYLDSECIWVGMWVQLDSATDVEAYHNFLDNYVRDQKQLGRFPRPLNNHLDNVMDWLTAMKVVAEDARIQFGLSLAFLVVCLLNTTGLMLAKFLRRSGEVGVRRALGASRHQIFMQYLSEAGMLGAAGASLGLAFAGLGLWAVRSLSPETAALTQLNFELVLFALGVSIVASLLAGLYPTWRACQIAPASQLKTQ